MDGNLSKALWIGVSILLFIAVVTIGISIFGGIREASTLATNRIGSITQGMAEEEFHPYDGKEVNGSQVISAISTFSDRSGEIIILVVTLGSHGGAVPLDPTTNSVPNINLFTEYISETNGDLDYEDDCIILLSSSADELLEKKSKTIQDALRREA